MHEHSPIQCSNPIIRFLRYLISPIKMFRFYSDGYDICAECNAHIALPREYSNPIVNGIYFLAGIALGVIMVQLPYLRSLIMLLLAAVFHHIVSALILAFFPWEMFDPQVQGVQAFHQNTSKENIKKAVCISIGLVNGIVFTLYTL